MKTVRNQLTIKRLELLSVFDWKLHQVGLPKSLFLLDIAICQSNPLLVPVIP